GRHHDGRCRAPAPEGRLSTHGGQTPASNRSPASGVPTQGDGGPHPDNTPAPAAQAEGDGGPHPATTPAPATQAQADGGPHPDNTPPPPEAVEQDFARRGPVRRFVRAHPWVMDLVVVACFLLPAVFSSTVVGYGWSQ